MVAPSLYAAGPKIRDDKKRKVWGCLCLFKGDVAPTPVDAQFYMQ